MRFITGAAIERRSVTLLAVFLVLVAGIITYNNLRVDLFPEIDFPLVTVSTVYPSANPEAVVRDVTDPVETAISGMAGLETVQSSSFEGNSIILATFVFGTDMTAAEADVATAVANIEFPAGVGRPTVGRFNPSELAHYAVQRDSGQGAGRDREAGPGGRAAQPSRTYRASCRSRLRERWSGASTWRLTRRGCPPTASPCSRFPPPSARTT